MQVKYKQEVSDSLYHQLPETTETQLAKELRDIYSEVRNTHTDTHILSVTTVNKEESNELCVFSVAGEV